MTNKENWSRMVGVRLDEKTLYLIDIASRIKGFDTTTDYVKWALQESFKKVSVDQFPELSEEPYVRELTREEMFAKFKQRGTSIENSLGDVADNIWSEYPFVRLQLLAVSGLDHLMSDDEKAIWNYIFTRKDLKLADGKLNRKLINERWEQINLDALNASKKKGKSK